MRLDQAIADRYPEISRRKARELLAEHRVLVNERPVSVASREVRESDRIAIVEAQPGIVILKMTDEWIAVDKPPGIAVQPGRDRSMRALDELLRVQLKRSHIAHTLYVVHRIDTGTSGVVLFARTRAAAAKLSRLFATGAIRKTYLAVVEGTLEGATIETPIDGRRAVTRMRAVGQSPLGTLVEAEIETGRTHQIRIHCASIGHPVAGDRRYGAAAALRLMLHAWRLEHAVVGTLEAPIPSEFL